MARLPHLEHAELDIAKLRDYCLSPTHPWGKHKARLFASALGLYVQDAEWFRTAILASLPANDAVQDMMDEYGQRWRVDMMLERHGKRALVRTVWFVPRGHIAQDLLQPSCYRIGL